MSERRKPRVKVGRRKTDIPEGLLSQFSGNIAGLQRSLNAHFEEHKKLTETLGRIEGDVKESKAFMQDLGWLKDISQGTRLLKSPMLWFLAFIVGAVALLGGVKALSAGFLSWVIPK